MKKTCLYISVWSLLFTMMFITSCTSQPNARVLKDKEVKSIAQTLRENDHLPIEQRMMLYRRLKKEDPQGYNFENEDEMTMYGYSFLWDNNVKEAIEIFKLIVEQFPDSSNPYDSLGEAYMVNGEKEKAIANYEKSIELNPDNFNAEDQIERMKFPNKKPEKPTEKFARIFTVEEYKADLDQLGRKLTEVHPNVFKFVTKEDFWKTVEEKKALITAQTTYGEFIWHCSEIIANVNCSHTSMGRFIQESKMLELPLMFPIQIRWVNDQLFVIDELNNADQVNIKDEILTINEVVVSDLINDIYQHIQSQGYIQTAKKHFFNTWATQMIPYALGFPKSYTIQVKGKEKPIVLNKAETFKAPFFDHSIERCREGLCFEILNNQTAVLTIASFNYYPWNNLAVFQDFVDRSFKKINEKNIKNLIIDVRFNGGGSMESSVHLLRYLVDQPFTYTLTYEGGAQSPFENAFKGEVYFLMDGEGNSTTGHFMSMVKVLKLGTIVGEELGSNQFCSAGQQTCRLSNTKLEYYVANNTNETTATSLPDEVGILPDHYVTQSIEEYLNSVDAVKAFTLKLINEGDGTK